MSLKVKILLLLFLSTFPLNASIYYGAKNYCIEDYYIDAHSHKFCYLQTINNKWSCTSSKKQSETLIPNYIYDTDTNYCKPNNALYFGLEQSQYNFLIGLTGLLIGLIILVSSVYLVLNVGGKK